MLEQKEIIIKPGLGIKHYWRDTWRYRELFAFLAWRDILVRYKQTVMGVAWSVIRPVLTMVIFTLVFNKLAKLPAEGAPYPIMVYAALLPWQLFSSSFIASSNSLISNTSLITKVYFPRVIMPASNVIVSLVDFIISFCLLLLLMMWYDFVPGWRILTIPLFLPLALFFALGMGLCLSALNAKYRDVRYVVPFVVQVGLYASPVGFSSSIVPEKWRFLYSINPMVGVIEGFRWAIIGGDTQIYWPGFILSIIITIGIFIFGFRYFRKTEKTFADFI